MRWFRTNSIWVCWGGGCKWCEQHGEEDVTVEPALDAVVQQHAAEPRLLVEPVDARLHAVTLTVEHPTLRVR